jgi:predicted RNA-binding Zn-ribbon protein involved in translation (DUF1610 family)
MVFKVCKTCGYIIAVKEEAKKAYCNRCKEEREVKERNDSKICVNTKPRKDD